MKTFVIYCHTNKINGKKYIGQTCEDPERRWRRNGSGYKDSPKFYNAILKYGWNNFNHEILEKDLNEQEANEREIFWIAYYDTFNNDEKGYNMTPGGNNYMKQLWQIPEYREKMCKAFSDARKQAWSNKEFAEKRLEILLDGMSKAWANEEWRRERIKNITGSKNPNAKKVVNIETGRIFDTIKDASIWAGLKNVSTIGECCKGHRKTSGKHPETGEPLHWRYAEKGGE